MKQLFVLLFVTCSFLFGASSDFASSMNYHTNYKEALEEAKKQNKPIMMVVSTNTCPWCRKLEHQTLKRDSIHNIVSTNFIPLVQTRDEDIYPKKFDAKVVPTIFFIEPNTTKAFHITRGYKNKKIFSKILDEVNTKFKGQ